MWSKNIVILQEKWCISKRFHTERETNEPKQYSIIHSDTHQHLTSSNLYSLIISSIVSSSLQLFLNLILLDDVCRCSVKFQCTLVLDHIILRIRTHYSNIEIKNRNQSIAVYSLHSESFSFSWSHFLESEA